MILHRHVHDKLPWFILKHLFDLSENLYKLCNGQCLSTWLTGKLYKAQSCTFALSERLCKYLHDNELQ